MIDIDKLRSDTPGCSHKVHLNNAGAAMIPAPVHDAVTEFLRYETVTGGYAAYANRLDQIRTFYDNAANLVGARPENIAVASSATDAFAKALSAIPFEKGDVILSSTNDYTSNQIQFLSLQKHRGVRIEFAPDLHSGGIDPDAVESLVRRFRPRILALTHVPSHSGLVQDVYSVGEICDRYDVTYLVDACQSVGQMPVDVMRMKCDFLSTTMRKFIRGPRGLGFLYVSDKMLRRDYAPLLVDMHGADWADAESFALKPDARRFEQWEMNYALVVGASVACRYAVDIGLEAIRERNTALAGRVRERFAALPGARVLDDGRVNCAITTTYFEGADIEAIHAHLQAHDINTSYAKEAFARIDYGQRKEVPWALRVSPHYYNTIEEVDRCADILHDHLFSRR